MNGDFLKGIAKGIFEEQGRLRQEQERKDSEQRLQTIQLLSSLAPSVEAGSLPTLMKHLGDVIGIKGRMRKFWDVFGGAPDKTIEEQLGEKVREITYGTVGPETARQSRETYKGELLAPFRAQGTRPRSVEALPYKTPPSLQGKMVFRDPRAEESEEFKQRSGAQLEHNLRLQEEKGRLDLLLERERERVANKKQEVQTRVQFNKELADQINFYRGQGVGDPGQARRLALNDYVDLATQLGIGVPALTPEDNKALAKVTAQINRLNQLAIRGGTGSGGDKVLTWIELSDGNIVPADKVNFDRLPVGVTVKKMFTTINGQPATFGAGGGGGGMTIEQKIEALKAGGASDKEIIDAIRQASPEKADELVKKFGLKAPKPSGSALTAPENKSLFADPEGAAFGAGGTGGASQEEIHRRVELGVMKSEVDWLRSQLDFAEKQQTMSSGVVQGDVIQKRINDLRSRLKVAEDTFKQAEAKGTPFGFIQR